MTTSRRTRTRWRGTRRRSSSRLLDAFAERGLTLAYPTQTTFTAAPDGTLVMPYAPPATA